MKKSGKHRGPSRQRIDCLRVFSGALAATRTIGTAAKGSKLKSGEKDGRTKIENRGKKQNGEQITNEELPSPFLQC